MACIPTWGAHGVQRGAAIVMAAGSTDKRQGGNTTQTRSTPQKPKPTRKGGSVGAGGNTRGR